MKKALPISALLEAMAESLSVEEVLASAVKSEIAVQITDWRINHEMTQAQFAEFCEVSQSTVSKWENGDFNFTIDKLSEIASKLNMRLRISFSERSSSSVSTTETIPNPQRPRANNVVSMLDYNRRSGTVSSVTSTWKSASAEELEEG